MGTRGRKSATELSVVPSSGSADTGVKRPDSRLKKPPRGLGKTGRQLWDEITRDFDLQDSGERVQLELACRAADDLDGQSPGIRLQTRAFIARTIRELAK